MNEKGNICMCCKGKRNNAGGYKWKYMQELEIGIDQINNLKEK